MHARRYRQVHLFHSVRRRTANYPNAEKNQRRTTKQLADIYLNIVCVPLQIIATINKISIFSGFVFFFGFLCSQFVERKKNAKSLPRL